MASALVTVMQCACVIPLVYDSYFFQGKYKRILEESSVADKLAKLDSYQSKHALSPPAW